MMLPNAPEARVARRFLAEAARSAELTLQNKRSYTPLVSPSGKNSRIDDRSAKACEQSDTATIAA
jgi:hypothetical protein